MQIKKDDTKSKIKESAKEIFFTTSYAGASMRDVASKCNMTVGNIYRYYENKEVLFDDIIKPTYDGVVKLIKITDLMKPFIKGKPVDSENKLYKNSKFKNYIISSIAKIVSCHAVELYILLNNSEGSKYENTTDRIYKLMHETILKMVIGIPDDRTDVYAFVAISTVSHLLKKYVKDPEKLQEEVKFFFEKLFASI